MKFKEYERVEYNKNTLFEVVFQARFPQIMAISTELPVKFQDTLRKIGYPESETEEPRLPIEIPETIRNAIAREKVYSFLSENADWKVSLSKDFIALTCNGEYTNYADFRRRLEKILAEFNKIYTPSYFTRIGLRYKNVINNTVLGKNKKIDLRANIPKHIAPEFQEEFKDELTSFEKKTQYADKDGYVAKVIHAYGKASGQLGKYQITEEDSYFVDIDCFTEQKIREVKDALKLSDKFNKTVRDIFRWSIGTTIHNIMEPET